MNIETCPECGVYCEPIDAEAFPKILLWKCPKCGAKYELRTAFRRVPETRADRIRAMSDEELAEWFSHRVVENSVECPPQHGYKFCLEKNGCPACWLDWLKQEATE